MMFLDQLWLLIASFPGTLLTLPREKSDRGRIREYVLEQMRNSPSYRHLIASLSRKSKDTDAKEDGDMSGGSEEERSREDLELSPSFEKSWLRWICLFGAADYGDQCFMRFRQLCGLFDYPVGPSFFRTVSDSRLQLESAFDNYKHGPLLLLAIEFSCLFLFDLQSPHAASLIAALGGTGAPTFASALQAHLRELYVDEDTTRKKDKARHLKGLLLLAMKCLLASSDSRSLERFHGKSHYKSKCPGPASSPSVPGSQLAPRATLDDVAESLASRWALQFKNVLDACNWNPVGFMQIIENPGVSILVP